MAGEICLSGFSLAWPNFPQRNPAARPAQTGRRSAPKPRIAYCDRRDPIAAAELLVPFQAVW